MSRRGAAGAAAPELARRLGTLDGTLLTIGAVLGTGIFLTGGDIARAVPHGGLILLVWVAGGLLTVAGAVTYSELGVMFPRAGGVYVYLKEAYGQLPGFLYGWTCFLVIMSGGIAALAAGFSEYLGSFVPVLSNQHVLATVRVGWLHWSLSAGQLTAAASIAFLTFINLFGVRQGAWLQNLLTVTKVGAVLGLVALGLLVRPGSRVALLAPLPDAGLLGGFVVAMIAALWTFDGWYGVTFSAGELRRPERSLPRSLVGGTAAVLVLYLLLNLVYLRALDPVAAAATPRIAESAAAVLFGPLGARLVSAAVLVSAFGCLAATILYAARIYQPMSRDGVFFRSVATIHPRYLTPSTALLAQCLWSIVLALSGTYSQLYTYTTFAATLFHVAAGAAVFVLRKKRPRAPRPYRTWGYPWVPLCFVCACVALVLGTLVARPIESLWGSGLLLLGLPAYRAWRQQRAASAGGTMRGGVGR